MSHRVYIGDYKKCKKKEGCSYVLDVESKALIECNCVSLFRYWKSDGKDK